MSASVVVSAAMLLATDVTMTVAQLAALGLAFVLGSFALNGLLIHLLLRQLLADIGRLRELVESPAGLLVRIAVLEHDHENVLARATLSPGDVDRLGPR